MIAYELTINLSICVDKSNKDRIETLKAILRFQIRMISKVGLPDLAFSVMTKL
jgi:hypothetical protein